MKTIHVLNYADTAEPLTFERISRDLGKQFVRNQEVNRIELWQHQLDWLAKQPFELLEVWCEALERRTDPTRIFGVEVEVLNP